MPIQKRSSVYGFSKKTNFQYNSRSVGIEKQHILICRTRDLVTFNLVFVNGVEFKNKKILLKKKIDFIVINPKKVGDFEQVI